MNSLNQNYQELISLTQLFLLREYPLQTKHSVSPEVFAYFQKNGSSPIKEPSRLVATPPLKRSPYQLVTPDPQTPTSPNPPTPGPVPPPTQPERPAPDPRPPETKPDPITPGPLPPETSPEPPSPDPKPPLITRTSTPKEQKAPLINLEPLTISNLANPAAHYLTFFRETFPHYTLQESIPEDKLAQKIKNKWLSEQITSPILILAFHETEKQLAFLKNVVHAISLRLAPARLLSALRVEKEKGWEALLSSNELKLVIASDYGLYLQPQLMQHYRENAQLGRHFLKNTPLLLLSDLALYLKEPQLKAFLWRAICNEFSLSQTFSAKP